jgi:phage baseplate assembly protein W
MGFRGIVIGINSAKADLRIDDTLTDAIYRVLNTNRGERMSNPEFGSRIKSFFFDPDNIPTFTVENEIKFSIETYIPYISVDDFSSVIDDGVFYTEFNITDNRSGQTFPLTLDIGAQA